MVIPTIFWIIISVGIGVSMVSASVQVVQILWPLVWLATIMAALFILTLLISNHRRITWVLSWLKRRCKKRNRKVEPPVSTTPL